MCYGTNLTKGVAMKTKVFLMKSLFFSVCLLSLSVFGLYKGCVIHDKYEYNRFLSVYDDITIGEDLMAVFAHLRTKPVYDREMTADNIVLVNKCGLKSLPPLDGYSELRFAAFPWNGIPHRFIFVFYNKKGSNVVAKAHCKM